MTGTNGDQTPPQPPDQPGDDGTLPPEPGNDRPWFDDALGNDDAVGNGASAPQEYQDGELPPLREVTAPTDTNAAEQVAPPSAEEWRGSAVSPEGAAGDIQPHSWPVTPLWSHTLADWEPPRRDRTSPVGAEESTAWGDAPTSPELSQQRSGEHGVPRMVPPAGHTPVEGQGGTGAPGEERSATPEAGDTDGWHPPQERVSFLPPAAPEPAAEEEPSAEPPPSPQPAVDVTRGVHRLHWVTVPVRALMAIVVFLAVPGTVLVRFSLSWTLLLALVVALGAVGYGLVSWWRATFEVRGDHLLIDSGLLLRTSREIPLSRLQAVDVVRPLLAQVLGLAELRIELAGGDAGEARLRYLSRGAAERLRASLLAHAAGLSGTAAEAPERPFYRLPFLLLLGGLVFRLPVLGAAVLLCLLLVIGAAFGEAGVLGGAVPLLLGLLRGFVGPLLRYTDFYASLSPDGVRLRYGIFQARKQTVPPGRVQAVRLVEPVLWRSLGIVRVEANVAGYVGERQMDSSTLLPVVPRRLAFALVDELFPGADAARVTLRPAQWNPSGISALGLDGDLFVARHGFLCHTLDIVPHARVQSVRLVARLWDRFRGVATVQADVPPGPIQARASGRRPWGARHAVERVVERGHAARMASAGPERWATRSSGPEPSE